MLHNRRGLLYLSALFIRLFGLNILYKRTHTIAASVVVWLVICCGNVWLLLGNQTAVYLEEYFAILLGISIGVMAGNDTFERWHLVRSFTTKHNLGLPMRNEKETVAIANPITLQIHVNKDEVTMERSMSLIKALASFSILFGLEIAGTHEGFQFRIVVPKHLQSQFENCIYPIFPKASVSQAQPLFQLAKTATIIPVGIISYIKKPLFWAPILSAEDINLKQIDPLASLLQPLSTLQEGEVMGIQLLVRQAVYDWKEHGEKQLYKGFFSTSNILKLGGVLGGSSWWGRAGLAMLHVGSSLKGDEKETHYETDLHKLFIEKLRKPFLEIVGQVVIATSNPHEQSGRIKLFKSALGQYESMFCKPTLLQIESSSVNLFDTVSKYEFNISAPGHFNPFPTDERLMLLTAEELAALWHLPTPLIHTTGINPIPTVPKDEPSKKGVVLGAHEYQGYTRPVFLANEDRAAHMMILGKTDMGKSTLMHNLIHQDIAAGRGVAVIDPHGQLIEDILECSIPDERKKDVVIFDLEDIQFPVGLSFFNVSPYADEIDKEKAHTEVMSVLKRMFAENWSSSRMEDTISVTISTLMEVPNANLMDIPRLFEDARFRKQALQNVKNPVTLNYWYNEFANMTEKDRFATIRPVKTRLRRLFKNTVIRNITCQTNNLDFDEIVSKGKIFLASLNRAPMNSDLGLLGILLVSKLQIAGMSRSSHPDYKPAGFYIYADELQNLITSSINVVFSEARKYGLSMTSGNQYLGQLEEGNVLRAILGNVGAMAIFNCSAADGKALERELGSEEITRNTLTALDRYHAVIHMRYLKKYLPPFEITTNPPPFPRRPERAQTLREMSRGLYAVSRASLAHLERHIDLPDTFWQKDTK